MKLTYRGVELTLADLDAALDAEARAAESLLAEAQARVEQKDKALEHLRRRMAEAGLHWKNRCDRLVAWARSVQTNADQARTAAEWTSKRDIDRAWQTGFLIGGAACFVIFAVTNLLYQATR